MRGRRLRGGVTNPGESNAPKTEWVIIVRWLEKWNEILLEKSEAALRRTQLLVLEVSFLKVQHEMYVYIGHSVVNFLLLRSEYPREA